MKKSVCTRFTGAFVLSTLLSVGCKNKVSNDPPKKEEKPVVEVKGSTYSEKNPIDTAAYYKIIKNLANNDSTGKWPAKAPFPLPGSILPFHRIVAFYGNLLSKRMGILGELPKNEMLAKLKGEVANWQAADTSLTVIPARHY